jgi:hypothetical protein
LYLSGVPVFYFSSSEHNAQPSNERRRDDCDYGSEGFKGITKMKTKVVLHILKKGYNVFWSDADIVSFSDQTNILLNLIAESSYTRFFVQSNEPDLGEPANGIR